MGEKVLIVANDKRREYQMRFANNDPAQNAMVGIVIKFCKPFHENGKLYYDTIQVRVAGRPSHADTIDVRLVSHTTRVWRTKVKGWVDVTARCYALRPYWDRTLDYAQGLQWPMVHVDATKYWDYNMYYMAVTRCESLSGLKISGIGSLDQLEDKARVHFKSIKFMHDHGGDVPHEAWEWARVMMERHNAEWCDDQSSVAQRC